MHTAGNAAHIFPLISDSQNGLLDCALSSALQGCITFCRTMQLLRIRYQSAPLQAFSVLKTKERLLHSCISSTGSGFKTVSGTAENLITVASLHSFTFVSCLWPQNSRSQCPSKAAGTHCLPVRSHTQQLTLPLSPPILLVMA